MTTLISLEQSSTVAEAVGGVAEAGSGTRPVQDEYDSVAGNDCFHPKEGEDDDARVILGLMTMEQVREERRKRRPLGGDDLSSSRVAFHRAGTG